jgi:hypothetical protein
MTEGMLRLQNAQREVVKYAIVLWYPLNTMDSCIISWQEHIYNHK